MIRTIPGHMRLGAREDLERHEFSFGRWLCSRSYAVEFA